MQRISLLTAIAYFALTGATLAGPARPHESWASGQLARVDTAARAVVVKQGSHEMTFALANDAQLVQGTTALSLADLSSNIGRPVKVRYSTAAGTKLASRVEVRLAATDPTPRTPHKS